MKKTILKSIWLHRLTAFVVCLISVVGSVQAGDHYFRAVANVNPVGGGKVYASVNDANTPAPGQYEDNFDTGNKNLDSSTTTTCRFWAQANPGYQFVYWTNTNNGDVSTNNPYVINVTNNDTGTGSALTTTRVAHFEKISGMVQVAVSGVGGAVTINNPNNEINQSVTITATPDDSYMFKGWYEHNNNTETLVSSDNVYTFIVTKQTTYYAHFELGQTDYCILKSSAGNYLSLYGDVEATYSSANGYVFTNGLKAISASDAVNNPMIVFKRVVGQSTGNGYLSTDVSSSSGFISTNTLFGKYTPLTFTLQSNGKYRISTKNGNVTYNLCDNGNDGFVSFQSSSTNADWEIIPLTENESTEAFGASANAIYKKEGKYYTSMYAPFAYRLLDGVNAYYLDFNNTTYNQETHTLTLSQISAGDIVPAKMPVIIECSSAASPTSNRLLPVGSEREYPITGGYSNNKLKGYTQIYSRDGGLNTVENDHDKMYILSIWKTVLGFYHSNNANMTPNKAYLELPVSLEELSDILGTQVNNVKVAFGNNFGDENLNIFDLSNDNEDDLPIYNLQGIQVTNPGKGIYIRGNKKYLVK